MSNELVPRSNYTITRLEEPELYDIVEYAKKSGVVREVAIAANEEMSKLAEHSIGSLAHLHQGEANIRRKLTDGGYRGDTYDPGATVVLQVTQQNMGKLLHASQTVLVEEAVSMMR